MYIWMSKSKFWDFVKSVKSAPVECVKPFPNISSDLREVFSKRASPMSNRPFSWMSLFLRVRWWREVLQRSTCREEEKEAKMREEDNDEVENT